MVLSRHLPNRRKQRCQRAPTHQTAAESRMRQTRQVAGHKKAPVGLEPTGALTDAVSDYMLGLDGGSIRPNERLTSREFRYRMITSGRSPAARARPVPNAL